MADTKFTNVTALEAVAQMEEVKANEPLAEKIGKMLASEIAKRDNAKGKSSGPSKEQRENLHMVREMLVKMADYGEPVTTNWLGIHGGPGWDTAHKASSKMNHIAGKANHWVEKCDKKVNKKVAWELTDAGREEAERVREEMMNA